MSEIVFTNCYGSEIVFNVRRTVHNTHSHILNIFHSIGIRSDILVAFNATVYNATISKDIPVNTVILTVGLITNRSATAMIESCSVSTTLGYSQPAAVPYKMHYDEENRGQLYVPTKIGRNQVTEKPYKSVVSCKLNESITITMTGSIPITLMADLEVRVVNTSGE